MDRKDIRDAMFPDCPIRNVLSRMMDKWTLLALYTLEQQGTMRFNDLRRSILDIRLKRASQLLRETEYTVAEISTMTGFASPKYFSVCFRRHYGQSPTEFKTNADAEKTLK